MQLLRGIKCSTAFQFASSSHMQGMHVSHINRHRAALLTHQHAFGQAVALQQHMTAASTAVIEVSSQLMANVHHIHTCRQTQSAVTCPSMRVEAMHATALIATLPLDHACSSVSHFERHQKAYGDAFTVP
jgi:hypothetical protein